MSFQTSIISLRSFEEFWHRSFLYTFDKIQKWQRNAKQFVWLVYYIPSVFELQFRSVNESFFFFLFLESADPVHESDWFIHLLNDPKQLYT